MLHELLNRFAPANEVGEYDRHKLWAMPHRFIPPNLLAAIGWLAILTFLTPQSRVLTDGLIALAALNFSVVIACFAVLISNHLGFGPDSFENEPPVR